MNDTLAELGGYLLMLTVIFGGAALACAMSEGIHHYLSRTRGRRRK